MLGLSRLGIGFDSLGLTQQQQQAVLDHVFNAPDATQQLVVSVKAADTAGARRDGWMSQHVYCSQSLQRDSYMEGRERKTFIEAWERSGLPAMNTGLDAVRTHASELTSQLPFCPTHLT